jgi:hypothetical protein
LPAVIDRFAAVTFLLIHHRERAPMKPIEKLSPRTNYTPWGYISCERP